MPSTSFFFFFFNDTATTEIYTLSLHDALPISRFPGDGFASCTRRGTSPGIAASTSPSAGDRKSTRLNSSHVEISYAVFCLKKKKKQLTIHLLSINTNIPIHNTVNFNNLLLSIV